MAVAEQQYITPIVTAISAAVIVRLAAASYPPLKAGKILLGEQFLATNSSPPKIVFVPRRSRFSSKDVTSALPLLGAAPYPVERRAQIQNRSVLTEEFGFAVHCWGNAVDHSDPSVEPEFAYNLTRALYHAVIAACDDLARGAYAVEPGEWTPQGVVSLGREFVFTLFFSTPILTELLPFVPIGTAGEATVSLQQPDGSTEVAAVIELG